MMETVEEPQWKSALARAQEVRKARAAYKQGLKSKQITAEDMLFSGPDWLQDMPACEVLVWLPGIQAKRARKACAEASISQTLPIKHLRHAHKERLLRAIRYRQPDHDQTVSVAA